MYQNFPTSESYFTFDEKKLTLKYIDSVSQFGIAYIHVEAFQIYKVSEQIKKEGNS